MSAVLKMIFSLSLSGSLLILVLLLGKPVYKNRISKRWQYYIWLVVIARLLLPFAPEQNLMGVIFDRAEQAIGQTVPAETMAGQPVRTAQPAEHAAGQAAGTDTAPTDADAVLTEETSAGLSGIGTEAADFYAAGEDANAGNTDNAISGTDTGADTGASGFTAKLLQYLQFIWLGGAVILLMRKVTIYQSFVKYIRAGRKEVSDIRLLNLLAETEEQMRIKRPVELYTNDLVSSPLLVGLFSPCIILPESDLPEADLRYTIRHELVHYRHFDLLYKWLVQITICLHWFNPLVWLMGKEAGRACELACDETIAEELDEEGRRAYGDTLLRAIRNGNGDCFRESAVSATLSESGELLKERLRAIMDFRKKSKTVKTLSLLLAAALLLGGGMTGAAAPGDRSKEGGRAGESGKDTPVGGRAGEGGRDMLSGSEAENSAADTASADGNALFGNSPEGNAGREGVLMETLEIKGTTYYLVFNEAQLRAIGTKEYGPDKNYMQQADIRMSTDEWEPVGTMDIPFTGSYNGNGFEIVGLTITDPDTELAGMFGAARDAQLYNITLRDHNIINSQNAAKQPDFPILACDLGNSRVYDNMVYLSDENITGVPGTDTNAETAPEDDNGGTASRAEKYYENGNLPRFGRVFSLLDESDQKAWLETIYADEKIAFFSVSLQELKSGSPLIGDFAQKAYEDDRIAFFSVLTNYMNKDAMETWLDKADAEKKFNFESVLLTALGRDWELEALQEEKDRQREEEYRSVGITMNGKLRYYQGQLVNIFLDMQQPGKSFYVLDMNPDGVVNVKIVRDEEGKIQGAAYMTDAEVKELFGDMYGDEEEDVTVPINIAGVEDKEFIWLGTYDLDPGDKISYRLSAKAGERLDVGFAKTGETNPDTVYCHVSNKRQDGKLEIVSDDMVWGDIPGEGRYSLYVHTRGGKLENVTGSVRIVKAV